jgi:nitrile hydratase subunit beta
VADRFRPGDRVLTSRADPPHHTRLPRYARGAAGTVLELEGRYPLPDDRSRGLASAPEPVYAVRFPAAELFGAGDHQVTLALWESYLRPMHSAGHEGAGHEEAGRDE